MPPHSKLPPGYHWKTVPASNNNHTFITITLVESAHRPGSWLDRLFARELISANCETTTITNPEELETQMERLKTRLKNMYFNWDGMQSH